LKFNIGQAIGIACVVGVMSSGAAIAATQTVNNSNFSITYDDGTSFGSLTLVGNSISFDFSDPMGPQPWIAQSTNGAGAVSQSDSVTLTLTINNAAFAQGYRYGSVLWIEGGDYERTNAASTVSVSGSLSALNAANANTFTQSALALTGAGLSVVGANTDWFAQAALNAGTACMGVGCTNAFSSNAQTLLLTVNNTLSAQSVGLGSDAFIEKKLGAGSFTLLVTQVPEASTWAMLAAGLGVVGTIARRRSQVA
jgi:PEP-CTERM motif